MTLGLPVSALSGQPGIIRGRVMDEFQRPLPGTTISVLGSNSRAIADSLGAFRMDAVQPGSWVVRATLPDFAIAQVNVALGGGDSSVVAFSLVRAIVSPDSITFAAVQVPLDPALLRQDVEAVAIIRTRQVMVNATRLRVGAVTMLELFPDLRLTLVVQTSEPYGANGFRARGQVMSPSGRHQGSAVLVLRDGRLTGNIRIGPSLYLIRPQRQRIHTITEVDPARFPPEPIPPAPPQPPAPPPAPPIPDVPGRDSMLVLPPRDRPSLPLGRRPALPLAMACSDTADMSIGRRPQVRLLVGYTRDARNGQASADAPGEAASIEEAIIVAVDEAQQALDESGIAIDLHLSTPRLVDVTEMAVSAGASSHEWLDWMMVPPADIEASGLRSQREAVAADIVILVVEALDANGHTYPMQWPRRTYEDRAYAVVKRSGMRSNISLAHEVGHLLEGRHVHSAGLPTRPPSRFTQPFRCFKCDPPGSMPDGAGWITIMGFTYDQLDAWGTSSARYTERRIARFSNPEVLFEGREAGVPVGSDGQADHRRAFTDAAATVASFRLTPAWFVATSAASPWTERMVAPEAREEFRLADLDGDGLADAFKVDPASGEWSWARDTRQDWTKRKEPDPSRAIALDALRFADFDGDGSADVMWIDPVTGAWLVSYGGAMHDPSASAVLRAATAAGGYAIGDLAFGDFDGDGRTDVFRSHAATNAWYVWYASSGSAGPWAPLNGPVGAGQYPVKQLRFGDFDGDGVTDVLRVRRTLSGAVTWLAHLSSDPAKWSVLQGPSQTLPFDINDLAVGTFDDAKSADILVTNGTRWMLSSGGRQPLATLMTSCHRLAKLWVADVDGDGIEDLLRAGWRP